VIVSVTIPCRALSQRSGAVNSSPRRNRVVARGEVIIWHGRREVDAPDTSLVIDLSKVEPATRLERMTC
jgi:hypothetical protein